VARRLIAIAPLLGLFLACASSPRPWKVAPKDERRFYQAQKACEQLTDTPEQYESCIERRGFRRQYPLGL
jgi:hypothetical protein